MSGEDGLDGGNEGDIRSLYYWSRAALVMLMVAGGLWIALGAWRLYTGLTWYSRDWLSDSTTAATDIATGIAFLCAAAVAFILARWVQIDIVVVFSSRRFQVPREKLLVYSILALPFGFIVPGLLMVFVNMKLSYPEFLPSRAEAYPEAMPGYVQVPREALMAGPAVGVAEPPEAEEAAPEAAAGFTAVPVTEEEAKPAPEFFEGVPRVEAPLPEGWEVAPAPAAPMPMEAYVEEVPEEGVPEEEIPEVVAEVAATPPAAAPPPAAVEAVVEEVAEGGYEEVASEGGFEEVEPPSEGDFEPVVEEAPSEAETEEGPRSIDDAHEELMDKLLGKR